MSEQLQLMARVLAQSGVNPFDDAAAIIALMNARFKCQEIMPHLDLVQHEAQVMKIVEAWS
jgi:hypothetical protein